MTSTAQSYPQACDETSVTAALKGVKMIPRSAITVQKVTSLDAFRSSPIDFKSLKPGVILGDKVVVFQTNKVAQ